MPVEKHSVPSPVSVSTWISGFEARSLEEAAGPVTFPLLSRDSWGRTLGARLLGSEVAGARHLVFNSFSPSHGASTTATKVSWPVSTPPWQGLRLHEARHSKIGCPFSSTTTTRLSRQNSPAFPNSAARNLACWMASSGFESLLPTSSGKTFGPSQI